MAPEERGGGLESDRHAIPFYQISHSLKTVRYFIIIAYQNVVNRWWMFTRILEFFLSSLLHYTNGQIILLYIANLYGKR